MKRFFENQGMQKYLLQKGQVSSKAKISHECKIAKDTKTFQKHKHLWIDTKGQVIDLTPRD